jgi:Asp-tRNA(Asn)/Glu-tRNA(Gln) amidotransferase A subunit family amidase
MTANHTIEELAAGLRARSFSCAEITSRALEAAAATQSSINAFITLTDELALEQAAAVDRALAGGQDFGPLMGIPVAVKDVFDVTGVATTAGSRLFAGNIAAADSGAVARLVRRGAIVVGKANMDQFAFGPHQDDYGRTSCPADPSRYAGGSSGGSAAAVAAGITPVALGTDAGGSTRFPAACCGVVGLKPTFGRISTTGIFPTFPSLDHVAPLATTAAGVRAVFEGLAHGPASGRELAGAPRIGVLAAWQDGCREPVRTAMSATLAALAAAAATIVPDRAIAGHDRATELLGAIVSREAWAALDGHLPADGAGVPAELLAVLDAGRALRPRDELNAREACRALRVEVDRALDGLDVLAMPTFGSEAWCWKDIDERGREVDPGAGRFLPLANLTGHPAISLPMPPPDGLPVGIQLIGRRGHDEELIEVAAWVERHNCR